MAFEIILISNYISDEVWGEINDSFQYFIGATIQLWEGQNISSHILLDMWLLIHARHKPY